ncbi:hypothetical protein D3C71_1777660 [compost metagenome]
MGGFIATSGSSLPPLLLPLPGLLPISSIHSCFNESVPLYTSLPSTMLKSPLYLEALFKLAITVSILPDILCSSYVRLLSSANNNLGS